LRQGAGSTGKDAAENSASARIRTVLLPEPAPKAADRGNAAHKKTAKPPLPGNPARKFFIAEQTVDEGSPPPRSLLQGRLRGSKKGTKTTGNHKT